MQTLGEMCVIALWLVATVSLFADITLALGLLRDRVVSLWHGRPMRPKKNRRVRRRWYEWLVGGLPKHHRDDPRLKEAEIVRRERLYGYRDY